MPMPGSNRVARTALALPEYQSGTRAMYSQLLIGLFQVFRCVKSQFSRSLIGLSSVLSLWCHEQESSSNKDDAACFDSAEAGPAAGRDCGKDLVGWVCGNAQPYEAVAKRNIIRT